MSSTNTTATEPVEGGSVAVLQVGLIIVVFALMLGLGATVTMDSFKKTLKPPKAPAIGMVSQFIIMPLVAFLFATSLDVSKAEGLSMVLIGCTPGGSTSNLFSYFARGDLPLSITMTVISNLAAVFMMPLLILLYKQPFTTAEIDVPTSQIILGTLLILIPVSIGLYIKKVSPDKWAWRAEKMGSVVGVIFIVALIFYGSFSNAHLFDSPWEIWVAAIFIHFVAAALGFGLGRVSGLTWRQCRTICLETGIQNTTLTIAIVTLSFPNEPLLTETLRFPLLYSLWLIFDALILTFLFLYMSRNEVVEGQAEKKESQTRTTKDVIKTFKAAKKSAAAAAMIEVHPGEEHVRKLVEAGNYYAWKGYIATTPEDGGACVGALAINVLVVVVGFSIAFSRDPKVVPVGVQVIMALLFCMVPVAWYGYKWNTINHEEPEPQLRSFPVGRSGKGEGPARRNILRMELVSTVAPEVTTIPEMLARSARLFADKPCLGRRELLETRTETVKGKPTLLKRQGEFEFQTYKQVHERVINVGAGLASVGVEKGNNIAIYADTKMEWQIAAQACFAYNFPVVTVYATLGLPALAHAVNETSSSHVIADAGLLQHLAAVMNGVAFEDEGERMQIDVRSLKHVVVIGMADADSDATAAIEKLRTRPAEHGGPVEVTSFEDVEKAGADKPLFLDDFKPKPDDMAVIMYTSGSTGLPKGVMMSHRNLLAGVSGLTMAVWGYGPHDVYLAYLPLAHVLELVAENTALAVGAQIGYGTPFTLTDKSPQTMPGSRGDAGQLRPTLMAAVPKVMDVIRGNILNAVKTGPAWKRYLFERGYREKLAAINEGRDTPFWNRLVFDKLREQVTGGRVRLMVSGGGPLAGATQKFMNVCFCCPVGQGYGLTETIGAGTVTAPDDLSVGRVGAPVPCCEIKLIDWEDGNYLTTDSPHPRGEILISGSNITLGYYNKPEKTAEVYKVDEATGKTWFYTGDIGEWHGDGCLQIIDRKKDLVKLARGEYVSYGKVESTLRRVDIVENICVYADPLHEFCIALVLPDRVELEKWANESGNPNASNWEALCADGAANAEVMRRIAAMGKDSHLQRFEVPGKITLLSGEWTPQNDCVTAALKLKRFNIYKTKEGAEAIAAMYGATETKA